jgi:hypothetical protein
MNRSRIIVDRRRNLTRVVLRAIVDATQQVDLTDSRRLRRAKKRAFEWAIYRLRQKEAKCAKTKTSGS